MIKVLTVGLFTLALVGSAAAQSHCPKGGTVGYCPPGTCGRDGTTWACYKSNCSAKNCSHNSSVRFTPLGSTT
jgi:hypothetical protein